MRRIRLMQSRSRGSDVCSPVAFSAFRGKKPGEANYKDNSPVLIIFPNR